MPELTCAQRLTLQTWEMSLSWMNHWRQEEPKRLQRPCQDSTKSSCTDEAVCLVCVQCRCVSKSGCARVTKSTRLATGWGWRTRAAAEILFTLFFLLWHVSFLMQRLYAYCTDNSLISYATASYSNCFQLASHIFISYHSALCNLIINYTTANRGKILIDELDLHRETVWETW